MSDDRKNLALAIIDFLKTSISEKVISEENVESIDVAVECIADAFEVDKEESASVKSVYGGKSLLEIAKAAVSEKTAETSTSTKKEVSAEDKVKAEALKAEGNKAIGAKDYDTAVAKYTEAIALDPNNVVYYSNRAAAYTSSGQLEKAVEDAEKAIELDSSFTKAYSRLGLAQYNLGNSVAAMKAYEKGIAAEGSNPSEAMKSGYETAKKRAEAELGGPVDSAETSRDLDASSASASGAESGAGAGAGAGGLPDFSSMFGGGAGGMPSLADMMSNPQVMQAAQNLMSNPGALQGLMNNPQVARMAQSLGGEGGLEGLMNNPMLRDMASQFMGGAGGAGGAGNGANGGSGSGNQ